MIYQFLLILMEKILMKEILMKRILMKKNLMKKIKKILKTNKKFL